MAYEKGFDEILSGILTDFRNVFPTVDVSQGSLAYMKAAGYASALWGLYRYAEWISRQVFPDTANTEALEHHGWVRGMSRVVGETDAEYLARLLDVIRRPPAGGNAHDYELWAKEVDGVDSAYAIPLAQGGESVDVVIVADEAATGSEIPDQALLDAVLAHIEAMRPVGARFIRVLPPTVVEQAVTMTGVGSTLAALVQAEIEAYLAGFIPGQALYRPKLTTVAVNRGAPDPVVTVPAATVIRVNPGSAECGPGVGGASPIGPGWRGGPICHDYAAGRVAQGQRRRSLKNCLCRSVCRYRHHLRRRGWINHLQRARFTRGVFAWMG